jgi:hypothetical protein
MGRRHQRRLRLPPFLPLCSAILTLRGVPSDGFPLFGQVYVKAKECTEVVSMEDLAVILGRNFTSLYPQVILSLVHFDFMVCAK